MPRPTSLQKTEQINAITRDLNRMPDVLPDAGFHAETMARIRDLPHTKLAAPKRYVLRGAFGSAAAMLAFVVVASSLTMLGDTRGRGGKQSSAGMSPTIDFAAFSMAGSVYDMEKQQGLEGTIVTDAGEVSAEGYVVSDSDYGLPEPASAPVPMPASAPVSEAASEPYTASPTNDAPMLGRAAPEPFAEPAFGSVLAPSGDYMQEVRSMNVRTDDVQGLMRDIQALEYRVSDSYTNVYNDRTYAGLTVNVPKDESALNIIMYTVNNYGSVTSSSEYTYSRASDYYDTLAMLTARRNEHARLTNYTNTAGDFQSIVSLQDRISTVLGEIDSYESSLKSLESSTSNININMSFEESPPGAAEEKLGERMRNGLIDSVENMGSAAEAVITFVVSALIPLAIAAVLAVAMVVLFRRKGRRRGV